MSKFLYFQDGHVTGKNSINRIGDYFSDWLLKFDELISIAKKNKVDAIIDGGDLFHSPIVSYSVCDAIVDRIEKSGLNYYCLFGNHAERYHSKEHSFDTTLAHILRRSKKFEYLTELKGKNYIIRGYEYHHNIEEELRTKGIVFKKDIDKWMIAIVHAFISPEPFPFATHVVWNEIPTNADLVFVAHYHKVWEKYKSDTRFIDIGCFGRNSITEAEIEPSCILLDTEKRSYEIIKLKSAKKGSEIFDLQKYEEAKLKEDNIDDFIQSLESTNFQGQKIEHIIEQVAKQGNIDKKVTDLITNKINEVQNEL